VGKLLQFDYRKYANRLYNKVRNVLLVKPLKEDVFAEPSTDPKEAALILSRVDKTDLISEIAA
jgi:hypothetical protein